MAVQNLLPDGEGAATSGSVIVPEHGAMCIVADGRPLDVGALWRCEVDYRMTDAGWVAIGSLDNFKKSIVVYGEGTYRVRRVHGRCIVDGSM